MSGAYEYLQENKGKYPLEQLLGALRKNGYPEGEIEQAIAALEGSSRPSAKLLTRTVWGDLILGLLGGWIVLVLTRSFFANFMRMGLLGYPISVAYSYWFISILPSLLLLVIGYFYFRKSLPFVGKGILVSSLLVFLNFFTFLF